MMKKTLLLLVAIFVEAVYTKIDSQTDMTLVVIKDTLTIVAVGDVTIGSASPAGNLPPDDVKNSFKHAKPYLKGDIVFGNLEGAILDEDNLEKRENSEVGTCYAFRIPDRYGGILREAGFNLMSAASNHANDSGEKGRRNTAKVLDNVGIYHAGPVENKSVVFKKDGVKYGFCAFPPNNNMSSINSIAQAADLVKELRVQADIVIVSLHRGAEGSKYTRVPWTNELFYGENRGDVHKFAHSVIDAGVDIVLGHGPHVTRAVEAHKGKFITYSMGNFNTHGQFNLQGANGIAPLYQIKIDKNDNSIYADIIFAKQTKRIGLELDAEDRVPQEVKRLIGFDFPEAQLQFEEGKIRQLAN